MAWRFRDLELPRPQRSAPARALPAAGPLKSAVEAALRSATAGLARSRTAGSPAPGGHPLAPAAIRVERSRSRRADERSDQTAVTIWFGTGPGLPGMGSTSPALRTTMRLGAGMIGAAALAAATAVAARRNEQRLNLGAAARPRLPGPSGGAQGDPLRRPDAGP